MMATPAEIQKLERIRQDMALIGQEWSIESDGAELRLCLADPADGVVDRVATLTPDISFPVQTFLISAAANQAFLLDLLDRCARAYRELAKQHQQSKPKDFAAECAMKCQNDQAFRRFLIECHDMPDAGDSLRIKVRVRSLLKVQSMGELNTDPTAADRWKQLRGEFDAWRRG
jgi:hypothetical protein